jgi:FSR family fosmidomycin resistance protein-like MFS transporter
MTSFVEPLAVPRSDETKILTLICSAHFISHYYFLVLAPLFIIIKTDFGVSFTEIGLALTVFNLVTAVAQTPVGFLVDRAGARVMLVGGMALGGTALLVAALLPNYWLFVAMFGLLGLSNTVYHPADYSVLSHRISQSRMGQAYSFHLFAGFLGSAVAPATMLFLASIAGWRGAFVAAATLGLVVAAWVAVQGGVLDEQAAAPSPVRNPEPAATPGSSRDILLTPGVLLNFVFFMILSFAGAGILNYSVVALNALHHTPLAVGNAGLSANLLMSAVGVLLGGWIASRTDRHAPVAMAGLAAGGISVLAMAFFDMGLTALVIVMGAGGFLTGLVMPSRDMLVRAVTPPGAFGRVFGFVTTGFNVAGVISPLLFGGLLDHGSPFAMLLTTALFWLACIPAVMINDLRRK